MTLAVIDQAAAYTGKGKYTSTENNIAFVQPPDENFYLKKGDVIKEGWSYALPNLEKD